MAYNQKQELGSFSDIQKSILTAIIMAVSQIIDHQFKNKPHKMIETHLVHRVYLKDL